MWLRDKCFPVTVENFFRTAFYTTPTHESLILRCELFRILQHLFPGISASRIFFCSSVRMNKLFKEYCLWKCKQCSATKLKVLQFWIGIIIQGKLERKCPSKTRYMYFFLRFYKGPMPCGYGTSVFL